MTTTSITPPAPPAVSGAGGGGGGGGGGAVAEPAPAVEAALPFTGFDLPEALLAALVLLTLGGASLALAKRRERV
ncbi:MAG: hypothetical protein ACRDHM_09690 [Actinomycetota bacterium]